MNCLSLCLSLNDFIYSILFNGDFDSYSWLEVTIFTIWYISFCAFLTGLVTDETSNIIIMCLMFSLWAFDIVSSLCVFDILTKICHRQVLLWLCLLEVLNVYCIWMATYFFRCGKFSDIILLDWIESLYLSFLSISSFVCLVNSQALSLDLIVPGCSLYSLMISKWKNFSTLSFIPDISFSDYLRLWKFRDHFLLVKFWNHNPSFYLLYISDFSSWWVIIF